MIKYLSKRSRTSTDRALKISSKSSLQQELDTIKSLFLKNGYPESVINARISKKILQFQKHPIEGPQRCPVYLKLPWIGETFVIFEKKIKSSILNCFPTVQPRVIFTTRRILPAIHKDVLPASQLSMVIYQYVCRCECRYMGRLLNVFRTESANMSRKLSATKPIKKEFSQREKVK